MILFSAEG